MDEANSLVGPGPSVRRPAAPDAYRKSKESWLPRNFNLVWIVLGIITLALAWVFLGDAIIRFVSPPTMKRDSAKRFESAPPSGEFRLTFPPEPPPPTEPKQEVAAAAPPPSPVTPAPAIMMQDEEEPEAGVRVHQPSSRGADQPKNPFGPVSVKLSMLGQEPKDDFGVDAVTKDKWLGCAIRPGYVVPVNLIHAVNSEIPGKPAIFEMREPYFSPDDPREPLLPIGTRFIGNYRFEKGGGGDKLGDTRVDFKVTVATLPPGHSPRNLRLDGARIAVLSGNGMAGLGGEVDQNLLPLLAYATIHALINSTTRVATDEESLGGRMRGSAAESYGDAGEEIVDRTLDVAPKITIEPGPALLLFSDAVRVRTGCR